MLSRSSITFVFLLLLSSCFYDKYNRVEPVIIHPSCSDSIYNSYTISIQPVIKSNCYSCHSTAVTQSGGLDLEDYNSFKTYLNIDFRGDGVYGSMFYHCIIKAPLSKPMPPTGKLTDCEIKRIKKWIESGAPNN